MTTAIGILALLVVALSLITTYLKYHLDLLTERVEVLESNQRGNPK